jgi:hypothetical protein
MLSLSYGQVRIALLQLYYSHLPIYNLSFDMNVEGRLDFALFEKCLNFMLQRHENLRLNVRLENDRLVPFLTDDKIKIQYEKDEKDEEAFINTPFKLDQEILLKVLVNGNRLIFLFSDLLIDGHTILTFFKELGRIYNALWSKNMFTFLPLKVHEKQSSDHFAFWQEHLQKKMLLALPVLQHTDDMTEQRVKFHLPNTLVKKTAKRLNITLFDYFTGLYLLLLYRISGQEMITIDTLFTSHAEERIGLYNDVVLLPIDFTRYVGLTLENYLKTYAQFLSDIKARVVPLEYLCHRLEFQSLPNIRIHFEYSNKNTEKAFTFGDAKIASNLYENSASTIRQLLTFNVCEMDDHIECYFSFRKECFTVEQINGLILDFRNLIENNGEEKWENQGLDQPPFKSKSDVYYRPTKDKRLTAYRFAGQYPDICFSDFQKAL